ncbi:type III secretion system translocon subunit SctE [Pleionea sediminis]|uniref:type III secretion system translocon subunit SctE n=1 Tax=Pleionea sediminis TaxID=2569479 RepID=UPI0011861907|nr:type III secretion system translocon subunit SctE [Pleionea sediminis]
MIDLSTRTVEASNYTSQDIQTLFDETKEIITRQREILRKGKNDNLDNLKNTGSFIPLEKPKFEERGRLNEVLIIALTNLSENMEAFAESIEQQLGTKRKAMKALLERKLRESNEVEQRRREAYEAQQALKERQEKSKFGRALGFIFPAVTAIGGAITLAAGVLTCQPALIAGGAALVASGACEIAAEVINMTGGDAQLESTLRNASTGLLVAGIVLSSYGAGTAAAGAAAGAKKGAQEATEQVAKKGLMGTLKNGANKLYRETTEQAFKSAKSIDHHLSNTARYLYKKLFTSSSSQQVSREMTESSVKRAMNQLQKDPEFLKKSIAEQAAAVGKRRADDAAEATLKQSKIDKVDHIMKLNRSYFGKAAIVTASANQSYQGYLNTVRADDHKQVAELQKQIMELEAELKSTISKQEFINKLIELLQEFMVNAIVQPVNNLMNIVNQIIQDNGSTSRRIAQTTIA